MLFFRSMGNNAVGLAFVVFRGLNLLLLLVSFLHIKNFFPFKA